MIKAVFLDVDNTLLDFNECSLLSIKQACEKFGVKFNERLVETFHRINNILWHDIEKGTITKEHLHEIRWKLIFDDIGGIDADGIEFEKEFFAGLNTIAVPVDGATELVEYLAGKYDLYVVSNAAYSQQINRLEKCGMLKYIKKVFVSDDIGFAKPSCEFFDACYSELTHIKPCETVIIGDSLSADIIGGINYGLKSCWFNLKKEPLPEDVKPDMVTESLRDIPGFL
ncbi:MAG: YjjG family noncanonical pyrimidine nucleotidase [Clostridia bacterium]|nr:YjjG family noncanonical pyrimidine nucleotidase [Clostridia bacterium]